MQSNKIKKTCLFVLASALLASCGNHGTASSVGSSSSTPTGSTCGADGSYVVHFDTNTTLKTNNILDQTIASGGLVTEPTVVVIGDNPKNSSVKGWFKENTLTTQWHFDTDKVTTCLTLYAKWVSSLSVAYYYGGSSEAIYTQNYQEGDALKDASADADLNKAFDGYKVLGYYSDAAYTKPFDWTQKVTKDLSVYVKHSAEISFNGNSIKRNFVGVGEGSGAFSGSISDPIQESDGTSYVKVDYGKNPNVGDPYIEINKELDISSSQKLKVTFKNLGPSKELNFYWIALYGKNSDGTPIYTGASNGGYSDAAHMSYYYTEAERSMSESADWLTKEFDLSSVLHNGVSTWGAAKIMWRLRIQSTLKSSESNVLWIKSIDGMADDTHKSVEDSASVKAFEANDSTSDLAAASTAQKAVNGFIFPKDDAKVSAHDNCTIYERTTGLVYSSAYASGKSTVTFDASSLNMKLEDNTTLSLRLRNLGYGATFTLTFTNTDGLASHKVITMNPQMNDFADIQTNLFGLENYTGTLASVSISYTSIGNDNAIIFYSMIWSDFVAVDLPGINFADKKALGMTSTSAIDVAFDYDDVNGSGIAFTTKTSGADVAAAFKGITDLGYESMTLSYLEETTSLITKVVMSFTIGSTTVPFEFSVQGGKGVQTVTLPIDASKAGEITSVNFAFTGTGKIKLEKLAFNIAKDQLDLSNNKAVTVMTSWGHCSNASFDADSNATHLAKNGELKDYITAYKNNSQMEMGAVSMANKTKLDLIYRIPDTSVTGGWQICCLLTDSSKSNWETAYDTGEYAVATIDATSMSQGMAKGQWATYEFDMSVNFAAKYLASDSVYKLTKYWVRPTDGVGYSGASGVDFRGIVMR